MGEVCDSRWCGQGMRTSGGDGMGMAWGETPVGLSGGHLRVFEVGGLNEEMREDGEDENALEGRAGGAGEGRGGRGMLKAADKDKIF